MLQDLVEFQFKAVNTQQTVTIIDAIHVAGVLHSITSRITRIVRVGKKMRDQRALPKARPNSAGPTYHRQRFPPYYMRRPYGRGPQYSSPPVQGEVMEGADNQGAGEQGRPVRQNMYRGYRPRFRRYSLHLRLFQACITTQQQHASSAGFFSHLSVNTSHFLSSDA